MKSKNLSSCFYLFALGALLVMLQCLGMSSTAIKKSKRIQGMLTQPQENRVAQEQKTVQTEVDTDSLDSLIEEADKATALEEKKKASTINKPISEKTITNTPSKSQELAEKKLPISQKTSNAYREKITLHSDQKTLAQKQPDIQKSKTNTSQDLPSVEFHFENTDLQNVVDQIKEIFEVTFISDDIISPQLPTAKSLKGNKISFKTNKALSKKDAWNLFISFLDLAGFAIVPQNEIAQLNGVPKPGSLFKIAPIESAQRSALRSFIGVDPATLPNNDETIRYVYFIENSSIDTIKGIIETLKSSTAPFQILQESKAFILTDKSYNIKSLMQIVKELDKVNLPQTLSVLKLRRADATQVKELYDTLSNNDDKNITARLFPARKQPTSLYFPENTRIFAEPRTNTLILLGPSDAIAKIEDFITKYIDVDQDKPYSPLKVYTLKYADSDTVANIMNNVTGFGQGTEAGKSGGVRGEDKYLKPMSFTSEKSTNRIIIRGDYEDYLKAVDIIAKLDEPQPQVAIEVLIVSVDLNDNRALGAQIRSKIPATGVTNAPKFQTSGLFGQGIVQNPTGPGVQKLLGNLLSLIGAAGAGNTVVSLGTDAFGVWGVFRALESIASAQVVSNPFLTTTNKTAAIVELGSTRRVQTATVVGGTTPQDSFGDLKAALTVKITPQINSDGMITLDLNIQVDDFVDATDPQSATMNKRNVTTNTIVADKEVLAIGGLIQTKATDSTTKVPILGDIPILGWLFKNKQKVETKSNILILVSTRIINPEKTDITGPATQERANEYRNDLRGLEDPSDRHDPVTKLFFGDPKDASTRIVDDYIFNRHDNSLAMENLTTKEMTREQKRKQARKQKKLAKLRKKESEALLNNGAETEQPKELNV